MCRASLRVTQRTLCEARVWCYIGRRDEIHDLGVVPYTIGVFRRLSPPLSQVKRLEEQLQAAQDRSERERQQSEQAVQHAQRRVGELEQAWQVLAAKVVTLADRNADLEWVSVA